MLTNFIVKRYHHGKNNGDLDGFHDIPCQETDEVDSKNLSIIYYYRTIIWNLKYNFFIISCFPNIPITFWEPIIGKLCSSQSG